MSIDISEFRLNPEEQRVMDAMSKDLESPLNYKIRGGNVCIKGGKKIPSKDLTRFVVSRSFDKDGFPTGNVLPVWYSEKHAGKIVNLLPFIVVGLSASLSLVPAVLCEQTGGIEVPFFKGRECVKSEINLNALAELRPLYENLLTNVKDLYSTDNVNFMHLALLSVLEGYDVCAYGLLNVANNKFYLPMSWIFLLDILRSNSRKLGRINKVVQYTVGRSKRHYTITNTERASLCAVSIWIMCVLKEFGVDEKLLTDFDRFLAGYQLEFLQSIGDDNVGEWLFGEYPLYYDQTIKTVTNGEIPRLEKDNQVLFNDVYGTSVNIASAMDMSCFHIGRIEEVYDHYTKMQEVRDELLGIRDAVKETEDNLRAATNTINKQQQEIEKLRSENESYKNSKGSIDSQHQFEVEKYTDRIKQLEEELSVLKENALSYYSDEDCEPENGVEERTIEQCVENINQYHILVVGGKANMLDELASYGVTSIEQFRDGARYPVSNSVDFFCVYAKFVAHKIIYYVRSHFNTDGRIVYYNGTNSEKMIRVLDDYINKWFEE